VDIHLDHSNFSHYQNMLEILSSLFLTRFCRLLNNKLITLLHLSKIALHLLLKCGLSYVVVVTFVSKKVRLELPEKLAIGYFI